jgi:hypothetical protein
MRSDKNLGLGGFVRRDQGTLLIALGTLLSACTSLIGVEDLHEGPRPGDEEGGSSGTTSGKGGSSGSSGGSAGKASGTGGSSGKGGSGASGGSAASDGGAGVGDEGGAAGTSGGFGGGDGGDGGENMGGDTGTAGTMGVAGSGEAGTGGTTSVGTPVRGKIIDFYRHPVPGITVEVNGSEVLTDTQGVFEVHDVPPTYDVSFVVEWSSLRAERYGWVFQGLTRRDPTLQVYRALNEYGMNTDLRVDGGAPTDTQNLTLAVGSQHGTWEASEIPATGRDDARFYWTGPTATAATAHSLMWTYDSDTDLPTDYVSYDTFPIALDEGATTTQTININVEATDITKGNISGTITDASAVAPINYGFLRFTSGATLELFEDSPGPATFSYLVPSIPNASVSFAALDEDWVIEELALVHQEGVAPGTTNIALEIPKTPSLTAPADGDGTLVDDTTAFRFQNRQPGVGGVVVMFEDRGNDPYQGIFVVTSSTNFTIPKVLQGGFGLRPGILHAWQVHAHGTFESVDAMASPSGYADAFSADAYAFVPISYAPAGPHTGSGTFTKSAKRFFTYQP